MKKWIKLFLTGFVTLLLFNQSDGSLPQIIAIFLVAFVIERMLHYLLGLNKADTSDN